MILAGDIGGTKTELAVFREQGGGRGHVPRLEIVHRQHVAAQDRRGQVGAWVASRADDLLEDVGQRGHAGT